MHDILYIFMLYKYASCLHLQKWNLFGHVFAFECENDNRLARFDLQVPLHFGETAKRSYEVKWIFINAL